MISVLEEGDILSGIGKNSNPTLSEMKTWILSAKRIEFTLRTDGNRRWVELNLQF